MGKNESESMKGQYREGCKGGWEGGSMINREVQGKGGKRKGEERERRA